MTRRSWLSALDARWEAVRAFALMGALCVISGGLVAASTAPLHSEPGSSRPGASSEGPLPSSCCHEVES